MDIKECRVLFNCPVPTSVFDAHGYLVATKTDFKCFAICINEHKCCFLCNSVCRNSASNMLRNDIATKLRIIARVAKLRKEIK